MEIVKKIDPKTMCGAITKPEKEKALYAVFGEIKGYRTGSER